MRSLVDIFSQNALVGLILGISVANRTPEKHTPHLVSTVGMARPRVADGGMASYMEGSCE